MAALKVAKTVVQKAAMMAATSAVHLVVPLDALMADQSAVAKAAATVVPKVAQMVVH